MRCITFSALKSTIDLSYSFSTLTNVLLASYDVRGGRKQTEPTEYFFPAESSLSRELYAILYKGEKEAFP